MAVKIQLRRGTAAEWTSANPTLLSGEQGLETDTRKTKIGDGVTAWNSLGYVDAKFLPTSASSNYVLNSLVENTGLQFADGSESAPSVSNVGDTNTGVFFPAADSVGVATGGTERVRVNSSGNVGIGTTSPAWNLDIVSAQPRIGLTDTDTGVKHRIDGNSTAGDLAIFVDYDSVESDPDFNISIKGTERLKLNSNGLITGTGTSLGAWTSYTPTLGGTGWAIGNGTATGAYCQIGKIVVFYVRITFGSTTTAGAGVGTLTVPVTGQAVQITPGLNVGLYDSSLAKYYLGSSTWNSTSVIIPRSITTDGEMVGLSTNSPFTWATSDIIWVTGTYQAA